MSTGIFAGECVGCRDQPLTRKSHAFFVSNPCERRCTEPSGTVGSICMSHDARVLRLQLKVIPGAARSGIEWYGERLKVKVSAVAERGRANEAVLALLAERLQVPPSSLTLVAGHVTPLKTVEIRGLDMAALLRVIPR